ncbi:MAG: hypothetical protein LBU37_04230 [Tannerellaceae bacterium]|jgi:hypothetical protein|nr:hypothetical protein [Tannerellaceae bacterium]
MNRRSTLKQSDKEFIAFANDFYTQVNDHQINWKLDAERVKKLEMHTRLATNAYIANNTPSTRNHLTSVEKKLTFGELKHFLSLFIDALEGNEEVTDENLADMHLRPRTQPAHKPLPVPTEAPLLRFSQQHDEITVYVTRSEQGQPAHGVQLKPYHGFKLRWKFEEEADWHVEISTRLHHTIFFDAKDETRRVTISAAWINPRLQEGPWAPSIGMVVG